MDGLTAERTELKQEKRSGLWYRPNMGDLYSVNEAYFLGDYGKEGHIDFDGHVVLDLGANIGAFSIRAAELGAKICHAYEPDGPTLEILKKNAVYKGVDKTVIAHQAAVSHLKDETLSFWVRDKSSRANSLVTKPWGGLGHEEKVMNRHIDDVVSELRPTLLKMDIEKAEWGIFRSGYRLPDCVEIFAIELHLDQKHELGEIEPWFEGWEITFEKVYKRFRRPEQVCRVLKKIG